MFVNVVVVGRLTAESDSTSQISYSREAAADSNVLKTFAISLRAAVAWLFLWEVHAHRPSVIDTFVAVPRDFTSFVHRSCHCLRLEVIPSAFTELNRTADKALLPSSYGREPDRRSGKRQPGQVAPAFCEVDHGGCSEDQSM